MGWSEADDPGSVSDHRRSPHGPADSPCVRPWPQWGTARASDRAPGRVDYRRRSPATRRKPFPTNTFLHRLSLTLNGYIEGYPAFRTREGRLDFAPHSLPV